MNNFTHFTKATPDDLASIDSLMKPPEAPERIYGWMDSQLSVARHYGGITYQGKDYVIAYNEDRQPLLRFDVLIRENQQKAAQEKAGRAAQKLAAKQAQGTLA